MQSPASVVKLAVGGQVITGFSPSVTTTLNVQVAAGEHELVAVTVTAVVPTLKVEPLPLPLPLPVVAPVKLYVSDGAGKPDVAVV